MLSLPEDPRLRRKPVSPNPVNPKRRNRSSRQRVGNLRRLCLSHGLPSQRRLALEGIRAVGVAGDAAAGDVAAGEFKLPRPAA